MLEIYIKDLVVEGRHGVNESEKLKPQPFKISVRLTLQDTRSQRSDDLSDTVNWSEARDQIIETVQSTSFNLIERLAQEITARLMQDGRIKKIVVTVDKPEAFANGTPGVKLVTEAV